MSALTPTAVALAVLAVLVGPAVSAVATPSSGATGGQVSVNIGSGWTHHPSAPLFDESDIVPGWASTATLGVRNDGDGTTALVVQTTAVVDDENGCNRPESDVDHTCTGVNAGELGKDMQVTIFADPENDGTFEPSPTWTGTIDALEQGATLSPRLAAGGAENFKIVAELPTSTGNETQSDRVAFDLLVRLDGATAGVAVEGTKITRPSHGVLNTIVDHLPFTGAPAMRLAAAGLSLLLAGAVLVLLATRRRRMRTA